MQNNDVVFSHHRSNYPGHNGLVIGNILLLLFLAHLAFWHIRMLHGLQDHWVLDLYHDFLESGDILV
jgi:hypothetical protein